MSDGFNTSFLEDPRAWLKKIAIKNLFNDGERVQPPVDVNVAQAQIVLDLVAIDGGWFRSTTRARLVVLEPLTPAVHGIDSVLKGAWVPYQSEGEVKSGNISIGKVAISKHPGVFEPKFVFTGAMNGCSFLLAEDYRHQLHAVHYPNSTGAPRGFPLLRDAGLRIVKSINFETTRHGLGYGESNQDMERRGRGLWANAFCCAFYDDEKADWRILCQAQICEMSGQVIKVEINTSKGDEGVLEI